MKKKLWISLIFTVIGIISGALVGLLQIDLLPQEMLDDMIAQMGSLNILIIIGAIQSGVLTFVASFLGLLMMEKVGLKLGFKWSTKSFVILLILGTITAIVIGLPDKLFFYSFMEEHIADYQFSGLYFLSSILYGGIIEEVLMRLFLMTFFVWVGKKLFFKKDGPLPNSYYIVAIILAALIFGIGHLPATAALLGLSGPIIFRALLLNGIGGLVFGYAYWKHGLAYAMMGHMMAHIVNQLIISPLVY